MSHKPLEWSYSKKSPEFVKGSLKRAPIFIPLLAILLFLSWRQSTSQTTTEPIIVFAFFTFISLCFLVPLSVAIHLILKARASKIILYHLTDSELIINDQSTPLSNIDKSSSLGLIKDQSLPEEEWSLHSQSGKPLSLTLETTTGQVKLLFITELYRQKFLSSLNQYFES